MKRIIGFVFILCILLTSSFFVIAVPNGATITPGTSGRANVTAADDDPNAYAGNITELTISGISITQAWQGYFGNVTGVIKLADISDNVMYNWSLASPEGEIYASNASSVAWNGIQCYNETTNLTEFEQRFRINPNDADGINETFTLNDHAPFYTNSKEFASGVCNNTKLYNNAGIGIFDEVLLTDGPSLIFASILQNDVVGFDTNPHDFQMIVLEDGHGTDTTTSTYYFWVELE